MNKNALFMSSSWNYIFLAAQTTNSSMGPGLARSWVLPQTKPDDRQDRFTSFPSSHRTSVSLSFIDLMVCPLGKAKWKISPAIPEKAHEANSLVLSP